MPIGLLDLFKYVLIALVWLFFLRVLRAVWVEVKSPSERTSRAEPPRSAASESKRHRRSAEPGGATTADVLVAERTDFHHLALKMLEGPGGQSRLVKIDTSTTIGRSSGCTISIASDEFASAVHARVYRAGDSYLVEDLGSTNGTFVNGAKISSPTTIRPGDRLVIGRSSAEVINS